MGERTSHAAGAFSWVDLATTDAGAAKSLYGQLFGWEHEDRLGAGSTYTLFRLDGTDVGGCFEQGGGAPPHWNSYVTVSDVDASMATAAELGGKVVMEAQDIESAGRMGVITDPTGAAVALWEPRGHIGAGLVNAPGALCWNDLGTTDPDAAWAFYRELLGWTIDDATEGDPMQSRTIHNGESTNGSIHLQGGQERAAPPNWLAYFATADLDETNSKLSELGGRVVVPPLEVPAGGRVSVALDPQGAPFGLFEGELDP